MAITKKLRFEVFKRDNFTCQYCGKSAPDVVLNADHIKPKSKGGADDILNLITSCFDCNQGKKDRELSDDSVVAKRRHQVELLQERQEQIEMMLQWHDEVSASDDKLVYELADRITAKFGDTYELLESYHDKIRKWVKNFSLDEILEAIDTSALQYLKKDDSGEFIEYSIDEFLHFIPGILHAKRKEKDEPYLKDVYYICGIMRNRFSYFDRSKAIVMVKDAIAAGVPIENIKSYAKRSPNWTSFRDTLELWKQEIDQEPWNDANY